MGGSDRLAFRFAAERRALAQIGERDFAKAFSKLDRSAATSCQAWQLPADLDAPNQARTVRIVTDDSAFRL
jgi:hypothetical protein